MTSDMDLVDLGRELSERSGKRPTPVFDLRIDHPSLEAHATPQQHRHVAHQALMRSYQGRFVLLPGEATNGSILTAMTARYDPGATLRLDAHRAALEAELLGDRVEAARRAAAGRSCATYIPEILATIRETPPGGFLGWLGEQPARLHDYRNFLIQSSADLLAEASASALGVIGEFGPPQSALFRILIDEFGFGTHDKKHSMLYRKTLRGFGVNEEYNACWPLFDTVALELHNTIHSMFQSPRHLFRQIGFLLYAETSYQVSTGQHYRYLRRHHPEVDATYFGEHAHIDIHHSQMMIEEVVMPLVDRFGADVGGEVILGAELTRAAFADADTHLLAVSQAFASAESDGAAYYAAPGKSLGSHGLATPDVPGDGAVWIGGIGVLEDASRLAGFPDGTTGRRV